MSEEKDNGLRIRFDQDLNQQVFILRGRDIDGNDVTETIVVNVTEPVVSDCRYGSFKQKYGIMREMKEVQG